MALARAERTDLVEFLEGLTPEQWDAATLCDRWRVREVVAHVFSYDALGWTGLAGRMVRAGFSVDRANAAGVADHAGASPAELTALARRYIRPVGLTSMLGGRIALTDGMIHQQDIRRPLGLPRTIPADRLVAALDTARAAPTIDGAKRVKGLKLVATDVDWTTGDGDEVRGTGEALLLAIAGRRGIADELEGPGVGTIVARASG
jgi:uncharacterized protein (TIGR03083 family)